MENAFHRNLNIFSSTTLYVHRPNQIFNIYDMQTDYFFCKTLISKIFINTLKSFCLFQIVKKLSITIRFIKVVK